MKKKDVLKVVSYFRVYGCDIYGSKHLGFDCGKNNLEGYFCEKLNWSESKLKKILSVLLSDIVLKKEYAEAGFKCYSLSSSYKHILKIAMEHFDLSEKLILI